MEKMINWKKAGHFSFRKSKLRSRKTLVSGGTEQTF